jgi:hypothetical protein
VEEEEEGHVQPPQSLGGDLASELSGLEEHSYSNGEGNTYGNVEWSDDKSDGGDLGDGTGIKYLYQNGIWKQEYFTYYQKQHNFVGQSGPNVFWNQFPTMM